MKRRNAECGKLRRPIKRNKITEGMYGSTTVLYMKFLILWAIVITADFMFMFRFEFLWPFWLLLRSVHDSFKYKGLAFSVLFVCIAITSDLVCLFFIPVHWLLFAASTYVWVQYVWHTDKGICLPTIILWMLFVYLEAFIRWKDSRHTPHLDLCRPFAAHCIGYPVVTLGFGFKSYVGYRMRQRKQREVAKENEFYMQLLQQALPQEEPSEDTQLSAVSVNTSTNATQNSSTLTSSITTTATSLSSTAASIVNAVSSSFASNATLTGAVATNGIVSAFASIANHAQNHLQQNTSNSQQNEHQINQNMSKSNSSSNQIESNAKTANNAQSHANNVNIMGSAGNSGSTSITATANGHIGGNTKNQRRSVDKESKNKASLSDKTAANKEDHENQKQANKNNNNYQVHNDNTNINSINNNKEKSDWDASNHQAHQPQILSTSPKEKETRSSNVNNSKKANNSNTQNCSGATPNTMNGNVLLFETEDAVAVEPVIEKPKGRRNRSKKDTCKDNHHQAQNQNNGNNTNANNNNNNNNNNSSNSNSQNNNNHSNNLHTLHPKQSQSDPINNNNNNNNLNSDASSVSSSSSTTSSASTSSTISQIAAKVVSKVCESCLKFEADIKKYRSEISHMKQIENELRQKLEVNLTTKSCLQAKQKECEELEKRIQELSNARHADMLQLQTAERRLTEERRQKQSLDAQLNNEKKARKIAEEKAARPECSAQCKQRKQQMDEDIKALRRELKAAEEAKQQAEQHGRKFEQELRICEQEIRNRDSKQPDTDMLMNAFASLQEQNCTLEKNLSAETRVKLDLFSALGDAKRQLEISEGRRRSKEEEVSDLKAKIAQLIALLPSDSLCLSSCGPSGASSMLRMNDTPPLQTGPGPSSPMLNSLSVQQVNQQGGHQLNSRNATNDFVQQVSEYCSMANSNGPVSQQQCSGHVPVSVATSVLGGNGPSSLVGSGHSGLDPNASIYKPKVGQNCNQGVGVGVVVGGAGDA